MERSARSEMLGGTPEKTLVPQARCPVCGDGFSDRAERRCQRCHTPHHADCWEYVSGCALFGCADTAPTPDVEGWSATYRLVLARTWFRTRACALVELAIISYALLRAGSGFLPVALALLVVQATALALFGGLAAILVGVLGDATYAARLATSEHTRVLGDAGRGGDRRLAGEIERRCGSPVWASPLQGGILLAGLVLVSDLLAGSISASSLLTYALLAASLTALFWITASTSGHTRVLANRFRASLEWKAREEAKPVLPGG